MSKSNTEKNHDPETEIFTWNCGCWKEIAGVPCHPSHTVTQGGPPPSPPFSYATAVISELINWRPTSCNTTRNWCCRVLTSERMRRAQAGSQRTLQQSS